MFVVGTELIEVDGKNVSRNGVSTLDVVSEPQLEAVLFANREAGLVVGKDVGIDAHQTTVHAALVVHAGVEDLVDPLVFVPLQPHDEPVDKRVKDVAVESVHVGKVVDDKVEELQNLGDILVILLYSLGTQRDSHGSCSVASVDPVGQEDSNAFVGGHLVANGCQAEILVDATVILIQSSQQAFAHDGCQMVTLDQSNRLASGQQGDGDCAETPI